LARRLLGSRVEDLDIDVLELTPEHVGGRFDVVFFLGVLYHMRHPLLALERVASVCSELLVVETEVAHLLTRKPAVWYFLEGDDWCAPTLPALDRMLRDVGFREVRVVHNYSLPMRAARAVKWRFEHRRPFWASLARGRAVVHAYR
jgi:tRNA (mo5U34)-methyltransferase